MERGILFFFVSTFFARRLAGFFAFLFPEALVVDADFLRVALGFDFDFDLGAGSGSVVGVDSASRAIEVVARLLRTLNARNRLDKIGRADNI